MTNTGGAAPSPEPAMIRTQVGIVGAGPAGLTLARLLEQAGIESVVLEGRSREYVEHRIRAGVLEQGTVELLHQAGVGSRLECRGHRPPRHRAAVRRRAAPRTHERAGGDRTITIYGQTEVVKDLIAARIDSGLPLLFEAEALAVEELDTERCRACASGMRRRTPGSECDFVAGL